MTGGLMREEPGVQSYRWAGSSHQKLYDDVKGDVQGTSSIEAVTTTWSTFIDGVTQTRGAVERLLAEAGAEWQGGAAQSMAAGVSPLAAWADQAAIAGQQSRDSVQQVAESFTYTANAMPEPVPVPSKATQGIPTTFPGMIAGQTDEDAVDQEAQQAHLRAIDVMTGYNVHAQESASSIGTFVEPQPIGVNAQADGGMGRSGGDTIETSSADDGSGDSGGPGSAGPGGGSPGGSPGGGGGPSGSSSPYPGSSPSTGNQSGTDAAAAQAPPAPLVPSGGGTPNFPSTSPPPASHPFAPITGVLNEPTRGGIPGGRGPGGGGGGGFGGRGGGGLPGAGGAPGTGGAPAPGRGGLVSAGPLAASEAAAARAAGAGGGRAGAPGAFGPMGGAGAGQKDEDKERTSAEYLRDYNDEFWDDTPPVAPPVIGEDDD